MIRHMKTSVFNVLFILAVFVASESFAATPTVEITARQISNGKAVEKVTTDATGTFQLQALPAGNYTLEFRCRKSPDLQAKQFTLTIRGTRQIGTEGGIAGTSLVGGVALNVEVGPRRHRRRTDRDWRRRGHCDRRCIGLLNFWAAISPDIGRPISTSGAGL